MPSLTSIPRSVWSIIAVILGVSLVLTFLSADPNFPAWIIGALLGLAGAAWFCLPRQLSAQSIPFGLVFVVGLIMRLIYLPSDPIREIDYYRYLWDAGAVQAGLNPFAVPPVDAILAHAGEDWSALVVQSNGIAQRINYGHLASIYPPVGQVGFWLAYQIDPWGLSGLRVVFLLAELCGVVLLVLLLKQCGRPLAWVAIYWWNPLVAKELINSSHMDALLLPILLGAVLLAMRARPIWSAAALGLAVGVKIWPLVLAPVLIWQGRWRVWVMAGFVLSVITLIMAIPMILGRLDHQSGLVAYAGGWERNHALFGVIKSAAEWIMDWLGLYRTDPGRWARVVIVIGVGGLAFLLGWRNQETAAIPSVVLIISATLFLLSPTGYPWYYVWILPFLCVVPVRGLLLLGVVLPFYYLRFSMDQAGVVHIFDQWIVWLEFGPVFALLTYDFIRARIVR